jgi:hypothetical protein
LTQAELITIDMQVRTWQGIDGEMDNVSQTSYEDGDEERGDLALSVREAGWQAAPGHDWPPDDHTISVTLDRARWAFIVECINASTPIYESLGDDESVDLGRKALTAIEAKLA